MRKIVITGMAAALAFGLTACGGDGGGKTAASPASTPTGAATAPAGTPAPGAQGGTPGTPGTPAPTRSGAADPGTPGGPGGSGGPVVRRTPGARPGGGQIASKWGPLHYLAPGKYTVGNVVFFTSADTVLYVAGGTCPDGSTPPDVSKCSTDGLDGWAQAGPHNVNVRFSGQAATVITETQ